jgi:hypothetical protein
MMNTKKNVVGSSSPNDGGRKQKLLGIISQLKTLWKHVWSKFPRENVLHELNKKGWKNIMARFHNLTGLKYEKAQLKNRYDSLRKVWRAWYNLFGRDTGFGWDPVNNTVIAPDEWWETKQLVCNRKNCYFVSLRYVYSCFLYDVSYENAGKPSLWKF